MFAVNELASPWEVAGPRGDLRGRSHYWMIVQMLQVLVLPVHLW